MVWDIATRTLKTTLPGNPVHLSFTPDTSALVALGLERKWSVWDLASGQERASGALPATASLADCSLAPGGRTIAVGDHSKLLLFDTATGKQRALAWRHGSGPGLPTLTRDGNRLLAFSLGKVHVFDLARATETASASIDDTRWPTSIAVDPSSTVLASAVEGGMVRLYDGSTFAPGRQIGSLGYGFCLSVADPPRSDAAPASFAAARTRGASMQVQLLRNGVPLRTESLPIPAGPLRLFAKREGDKLALVINGVQALVFHDVAPLPAAQTGVFALVWPAGVGLRQLQAQGLTTPPAPSALEQADDLFDRQQWGEALPLYQGAALAASEADIRQESRYKAAQCLTHLGRLDDAALLLAPLVNESGTRWPALAALEMCLLRLQQNQLDDIEPLLTSLSSRYQRDELSAYASEQTREQIMRACAAGPSELLTMDVRHLRKHEVALALAQLFQNESYLYHARYGLSRALCVLGQEEKGLPLARDCAVMWQGKPFVYSIRVFSVRWASWVMRRHGEAQQALELIDQALAEHAAEQLVKPLLLDRARTLAVLERWSEAEQAVDTFLAPASGRPPDYESYAAGWLLKGFFHQRRGDSAQARQAWQQGLYGRWLAPLSAAQRQSTPALPSRHGLVFYAILGSLTGEISDADATGCWAQVITDFGRRASFPIQLADSVKVSPAILRGMWVSPRGQRFAEDFAFHRLSPRAHYRAPAVLALCEKIRQDAYGSPISAEQDELAWDLLQDCMDSFFAGKLSQPQMLGIALTWKGTTSVFGWAGLAPSLAPPLRGPLAYVMGMRYVRLGRPRDAAEFFRTARADAPPDTPLRRLAEAELRRMPGD